MLLSDVIAMLKTVKDFPQLFTADEARDQLLLAIEAIKEIAEGLK